MTVSFVGAASAESTSLTLPAHQTGDLLVMVALRSTSTANTLTPSGWLQVGSNTGLNTDSLVVSWKIATSAAEVSGTWTNASFLLCAVYRDDVNLLGASIATGSRSVSGGTATPSFPFKVTRTAGLVTPSNTQMMSNSSVVVGVVASTSSAVSLAPAPSGMTNRVASSGVSANQIAVHDTGSPVASWATTNATLAGITPWLTQVIELTDLGFAKASAGGMLIHPGMSGGMRG
jgi:hypothetical protein